MLSSKAQTIIECISTALVFQRRLFIYGTYYKTNLLILTEYFYMLSSPKILNETCLIRLVVIWGE